VYQMIAVSRQTEGEVNITALCSDKDGEDFLVDGSARGEVRSEPRQKGLRRQPDDGLADFLLLEGPSEVFADSEAARPESNSGVNTPELARGMIMDFRLV
jgi:hypothetical protein